MKALFFGSFFSFLMIYKNWLILIDIFLIGSASEFLTRFLLFFLFVVSDVKIDKKSFDRVTHYFLKLTTDGDKLSNPRT